MIDRTLASDLGTRISVGLASLAADKTLEELVSLADPALLDPKKAAAA